MGLDLGHYIPSRQTSETVDYFLLNELNVRPGYIERHRHLIVEKDFDEFDKNLVMYVKTKGYQRKGMKRKFYSEFKNDGLYFDLESVKKAYHYLEADHISTLSELQENFQKNFIDNFVEGESIFHISW